MPRHRNSCSEQRQCLGISRGSHVDPCWTWGQLYAVLHPFPKVSVKRSHHTHHSHALRACCQRCPQHRGLAWRPSSQSRRKTPLLRATRGKSIFLPAAVRSPKLRNAQDFIPRGIQSYMWVDYFPGCSRHLRLQAGSLQVTWLPSQINILFPNLSCTPKAPLPQGLRYHTVSQAQIQAVPGPGRAGTGWLGDTELPCPCALCCDSMSHLEHLENTSPPAPGTPLLCLPSIRGGSKEQW